MLGGDTLGGLVAVYWAALVMECSFRLGRCSPESVNFNDRARGGVVRAGLKNFKLCMLLDILLYFEEIKHLVLGGGRAVGPRGSSFFWTLTEISPESVNFQRQDC